MAGSSIGQGGHIISAGDYVKIPYAQIGTAVGAQTSYIGVCLIAGGNAISGVYLTSAGSILPFANIPSNQCQQLGQASSPGNQTSASAQN